MKSERTSKLNSLVKSIGEIAKEAKRLSRIAECQYSAEVEAILKTQSRDSRRIERCLDGMLDFCFDSGMLLLYKKLCRYYFQIDPQATASYIYAYRDMWDNQDKEGRGDRTTGNAGKRQRRQMAPKKLKMKI